MGWADHAIEALRAGEPTEIHPHGHSMEPLIKSGQCVLLDPVDDDTELKKGDIVLCKVYGRQYLHLIKKASEGQYQIGNNRGRINGWISRSKIYGIVTKTG